MIASGATRFGSRVISLRGRQTKRPGSGLPDLSVFLTTARGKDQNFNSIASSIRDSTGRLASLAYRSSTNRFGSRLPDSSSEIRRASIASCSASFGWLSLSFRRTASSFAGSLSGLVRGLWPTVLLTPSPIYQFSFGVDRLTKTSDNVRE